MKPITVFFETGSNHPGAEFHWRPGKFKGRFKDGYFIRFYWLCFAIGWVRMDLFDYNRHIETGATEWRLR